MKTLIAAAIGAGTMGAVSAAAFAVTQRSDMSKIVRNSQIAAGLAIVAGLYVAKKKNALYGVAIATAGAALLVSTKVAVLLGGFLNKPTSPAMAAVYGNMGAYARMQGYSRQMGAYAPQMQAVYGNMGAVYGNMGAASRDFVPQPNWRGNPF
jgi:hypothetical protein